MQSLRTASYFERMIIAIITTVFLAVLWMEPASAKPHPERNLTIGVYQDPLCTTWQRNTTVEERKCLPAANGTSGKLHCLKMQKQRCIDYNMWTQSTTCAGAVSLKSASRCGACEPAERGSKYFRIECGNPNATTWDGFYCTEPTCRPESCNKTTIVANTCHRGLIDRSASFIVSPSYECPDVVAWVKFTDANCTKADKDGANIFPGNACMDGYKYYCPAT